MKRIFDRPASGSGGMARSGATLTIETTDEIGDATPYPSPPPQGGRGFDATGENSQHSDASAVRANGHAVGTGAREARDGFIQIRVAGAPYEMGLQHGELLHAEIRDLI